MGELLYAMLYDGIEELTDVTILLFIRFRF